MKIKILEKFEYISPNFNGLSVEKVIYELNKLGLEGWEVIHIKFPNTEEWHLNWEILLKRKINIYND